MNIVNDVLDYSAIENNKLTLISKPFSIADAMQEMKVVYSALTENKNITYSVICEKMEYDIVSGDSMAGDCAIAGSKVNLWEQPAFKQNLTNITRTGIKLTGNQFSYYGFERKGTGYLNKVTTDMLLCTPLLMPLMTSIGINPIHFAAIIGVNLGMGNITPPTAPLLYIGCRLTGASLNETLKPTMQMIGFAWIPTLILTTYIPQIALFLPTLFGFA